MGDRILIANEGGTFRFLGRQYGVSGKLEHFRAFREDLEPHINRVKNISQNLVPGKSEYRYLGSVSRIVIHDWLTKQNKNWNQFVTDKDLKAKFMAWYKTEFSKLMVTSYAERSLATNRSKYGRFGPSLGTSILNDWRKENGA